MPLTGVKLSQKQQDELKEAFIIYDTEGNGKVNREQAACVLRSIALSPTNEELNSMLGDRDRVFTLSELQNKIATQAPPFESEENLKESFRIFDKEGNGFFDAKEMRHVLVHLGEKLKDDEVDELMREMDVTGDNQVSIEEAVRVIHCLV